MPLAFEQSLNPPSIILPFLHWRARTHDAMTAFCPTFYLLLPPPPRCRAARQRAPRCRCWRLRAGARAARLRRAISPHAARLPYRTPPRRRRALALPRLRAFIRAAPRACWRAPHALRCRAARAAYACLCALRAAGSAPLLAAAFYLSRCRTPRTATLAPPLREHILSHFFPAYPLRMHVFAEGTPRRSNMRSRC